MVFHRGDRVTEGAHSNIHIIKDGIFITPPADQYILPGVARAHLMKMSKKLDIPVEERIFSVNEMMEADEVIVSSSSNFCMSVCEIDGHEVGGRAQKLLRLLKDALMEEYLITTNQK